MLALFLLTLALLIASNLWFYLRVLRPVRRLSSQAERLTQGNLDALERECGGLGEIQTLRRAMAGMVGHVRRAQEQSRLYTDKLTEGQEIERKRIAHELHDDTIQALVAVAQSIDLAKHGVQNPQAATMLGLAREQAVNAVANLRNLIADLRPPALEELGLVAAVEMQAQRLGGIPVTVDVEGTQRRLSEAQELTLFRAVQEALNNAERHSHADAIRVTLTYAPESVAIRVCDNGRGFHVPSHLLDLTLKGHYGLSGMSERLESLGGRVHIASTSHGTTLDMSIPVRQPQPESVVRDPVCSATLEPNQAYGSVRYQGETYYFCCPVCQGAFQRDPAAYVEVK